MYLKQFTDILHSFGEIGSTLNYFLWKPPKISAFESISEIYGENYLGKTVFLQNYEESLKTI